MNTNILDYMYEGYGYDMDNQLLYTGIDRYKEAHNENGISDNGMETFAHQGIIGHDPQLDVVNARKWTELGQFRSENGANYTDIRPGMCDCGKE